jgi:uncharacterized protein
MKKKPQADAQHALWSGDPQELRKLWESKADLNHPDADGRTLLIEATLEKRLDLAKLLLEHGADPKPADREGSTALHYAAHEHLPELVQLLIDKGAPIDAVDRLGNTPLHRALMNYRGQAEGNAIWALLLAGANRTQKNTHGVSPEDLGKQPSNYDPGQFFR